MKRPLCAVGFAMLATLFVLCEMNSIHLSVGICGLFAFAAIVCLLKRTKGKSTLLITIFLSVSAACLLFLGAEAFYYYPAEEALGVNEQVTAFVTDYPTADGERYHCMAKIELPNSSRKVKIRLSFAVSSKIDAELEDKVRSLVPGDKVSFCGTVYKIGASEKNIEQSFKSRKIFLGAYPKGRLTTEKPERRPILYYLKHERQKVINQLLSSYDSETAAIAISVLLGDKSFLSDETYSAFRRAGVSHIMAVSGLHLSVWIMFLMNMAVFLGANKRNFSVFLMAFVFLVMNFACFSGSVMRAGFMMLLYLGGFAFGKTPDALNSLGFSAFIILLINPYSAVNAGFLLSVTSSLAIIIAASPASAYLSEKLKPKIKGKLVFRLLCTVINSVLTSFFTFVFTFPLLLLFFSGISLAGTLTNLLFLPAVTVMIVLFGLYVMLYFIPGVSSVLFYCSWGLSLHCRKVALMVSSWENSYISIEKSSVLFVLVLFAVCFASVCYALKKRERITAILAAVLLLTYPFVCAGYSHAYALNHVVITVFDVGNGLCVNVSSGGKSALLFAQSDDYYVPFILDEVQMPQYVFVPDSSKANLKLLSAAENSVIMTENNDGFPAALTEKIIECPPKLQLGNAVLYFRDGAVYISAYGFSALVTEKKAESADVIITDNLQTALDINSNSAIIFSGDNIVSLSTAQQSDITVSISKNSRYSIKGENSWQNLTKNNSERT